LLKTDASRFVSVSPEEFEKLSGSVKIDIKIGPAKPQEIECRPRLYFFFSLRPLRPLRETFLFPIKSVVINSLKSRML